MGNYDNWKLEPSPYEDVLTYEEWVLEHYDNEFSREAELAYAEYLLNPYTDA